MSPNANSFKYANPIVYEAWCPCSFLSVCLSVISLPLRDGAGAPIGWEFVGFIDPTNIQPAFY